MNFGKELPYTSSNGVRPICKVLKLSGTQPIVYYGLRWMDYNLE
jgi:hypothetical protein